MKHSMCHHPAGPSACEQGWLHEQEQHSNPGLTVLVARKDLDQQSINQVPIKRTTMHVCTWTHNDTYIDYMLCVAPPGSTLPTFRSW